MVEGLEVGCLDPIVFGGVLLPERVGVPRERSDVERLTVQEVEGVVSNEATLVVGDSPGGVIGASVDKLEIKARGVRRVLGPAWVSGRSDGGGERA